MTKCLLSVCVCLSGLVLSAGCAGTEAAPPQPQPQAVQRVEGIPSPDRGQGQDARDTSLAAEPNETATAKVKEATVEKPGAAEPKEARPAEPNIPAARERGTATPGATDNPQSTVPPPKGTNEPNTSAAGGRDGVKPEATENPKSEIRNPKSAPSFIQGYGELLRDYVQDDGYVDYGSLRRRRLEVKQLVMDLGELDPNIYASWPKGEQLAFWINAYNLKMLEIITRNYPIQSSRWLRLTWPPTDIRHIAGIWTDYRLLVMDEEFTLAEVERRFFHTTLGDPRAYLAITYACRSGPPLRKKPYEGKDLDRQLDEQVKTFLSGPQGFSIDRRNMVVHLSAIFKPAWRGKEFVPRYGTDKKFKGREPETRAVLNFITNYLSREDAYFLETENYAIEYMSFDWRLNDASRG